MTPATEVTGEIDTPAIDEFRDLVHRSFLERGREPSRAMVDPYEDGLKPILFRSWTLPADEIRMSLGAYERLNREVQRLPGNRVSKLTQLWGIPIHEGKRVRD